MHASDFSRRLNSQQRKISTSFTAFASSSVVFLSFRVSSIVGFVLIVIFANYVFVYLDAKDSMSSESQFAWSLFLVLLEGPDELQFCSRHFATMCSKRSLEVTN